MGIPNTFPNIAAPPYDDVINNHPVNLYPATGSTSGYTTLPQSDDCENEHTHQSKTTNTNADIELHAHTPTPSHQTAHAAPPAESFTQTLASLLRPRAEQPHTHCAVCDEQVITAARRKHDQERHCCTMVAVTFMSLFLCGMVLGVVIVNASARQKRDMGV